MDSKAITRKDFFTLTFTLIGGAAVAAGCSSSTSSSNDGGGSGGAGGAGTGGSGSGGSAANDAATDQRGDTGPGDSGISCTSPLLESQVSDATGHSHTLTIQASDLTPTTDTTFLTGGFPLDTSGAHFHGVKLTAANLATLRGGGSVTVTSDPAGDPMHMHMYMISCH